MRTLFVLLAVASSAIAQEDPFSSELCSRLAAADGNLVFSPLSVRVALAMAYGGARGPTADEMAKVLRCDGKIHAEIAALAKAYDGKDGRPALANSLWVQEGAPLLPAYLDLLKTQYGAPPAAVDFKAADAVARRINAWVAERTRDRIREIVDPEMFNANTKLVLANALYFKGAWETPFHGSDKGAFTLASGEKFDADFMRGTETFGYGEKDGAKAVELPYKGGRFSMVVILPAPGADAVPDGLLAALGREQVDVRLPRFRIESAFRLDGTLQAMGIKAAFGHDADFSGMDGKDDLFIATVAHAAFVAVDENGTEAAAATAVLAEEKGEARPAATFRADRPFLFLIRDRETKATLFLGRVSDPRK